MRRLFFVALLALSFSIIVVPAQAQVYDDPFVAARAAIAWLETQQQANGSFVGFSAGDSAFDPIFAFVAAGIDPRRVAQDGGTSLLAYAESVAATYSQGGAGAAAKATLAAHAAGADPRDFGGVDLVAAVTSAYNPTTGLYGTGAFDHSLALLALDAVGETVPTAAITALVDLQADSGGWEYRPGFGGEDTNTTALAIQALVALDLPPTSTVFAQARAYLRSVQNGDGGFPYSAGGVTDANSTGYVLQALAALGDSPTDDWAREGGNPLTALLGLQNASGAFRSPFTGTDDNLYATLQAIPGLLFEPFPMQLRRVFLPLVVK